MGKLGQLQHHSAFQKVIRKHGQVLRFELSVGIELSILGPGLQHLLYVNLGPVSSPFRVLNPFLLNGDG